MEKRYRVILASHQIYKEAELMDGIQRVLVGTSIESDVRFPEKEFFEPFSFYIEKSGDSWQIECSDNIYVSDNDARKLAVCRLKPGNTITVKYRESGSIVLSVLLRQDFEHLPRHYDRMIDLSSISSLKIGSDESCQIRLNSLDTRNDRLSITKNGGWFLKVEHTGFGTDLNGVSVTGINPIFSHDFISVGPYSFCFDGNRLYFDSTSDLTLTVPHADVKDSLSAHQYPKFNRSSRVRTVLNDEKIEILDPPSQPQQPRSNMAMQLLPAVAMLGVTVVARTGQSNFNPAMLLMSAGSVGVGVMTSVLSIKNEKKKYAEDVAKRISDYNNYISEKKKVITEGRSEEARLLDNTYYSVEREMDIVRGFRPELFERVPEDKDFLEIRLGKGEREAVRPVTYKKLEQIEPADELQLIPEKIAEEFKMLKNVPVTIDLKSQKFVGITGKREALYNMLKVLTLDLAVRHYYTDLQLFYCIGDEDQSSFSWLRLLPHVQNEPLNRRNIICDDESRSILLEYLYKQISHRTKGSRPHIVVFVYRDRGIQNHPLTELLEQAEDKGVTFIYFSEHEELLPKSCGRIIRMKDKLQGESIDTADGTKLEHFTAETLDDRYIAGVSKKLAPVYCEEISLESELTKNISFFEMMNIYGPEDIDLSRSWANSEIYKSMAAPLGVKSKNQMIYLDLHEKAHGPHGLVAGTTGSGKSEILQTYILSMALRFHPYEVGFVIIDFKGGGMVNQFRSLPHLIGAITNIDGREIDRSLLSIRAELKKRQELFSQYNVNHIDAYIKLYKQGITKIPLPHLILIVDEFAELKMDQPEFMKELISAARIGRSLGVHLILATQKPSGVIDPQIWSNSKFKLCLKVQSKEDSNEVLKNPLAAEIVEPGRAYLQVGNNEVFELFQSAYSGASSSVEGSAAKRKFAISKVSLSGKRTPVYEQKPVKSLALSETQLESVVSYVDRYCKTQKIKRLPFICLPPLPTVLRMDGMLPCGDAAEGLKVYSGIYDDPSRQYQGLMEMNITEANTIIIGSAQNGKTNLLQTIIRSLASQYTPQELNLYILDFGSMIFRNFEELNHVGGVVFSYEDEKCRNLFKMLNQEVQDRKEKLAAAGVSSFASYLEAGFENLPQIVVVIDNLTAMRELYLTENDFLLPLCREGIAVGITFVIANAQTSGIGYKYLSNFERRIALYCNDSTEYNVLFDGCRIRPLNTPGRCLFESNKTIYEAQTYLAFEGEKEIERVAEILRFVKETNAQYPDMYAKAIPVVPKELTSAIMRRTFHCESTSEQLAVGIEFDQVAPVALSWNTQQVWALSGKAELGRTQFIRYMVQSLLKTNAWLFAIDDFSGKLAEWKSHSSMKLYSKSADDIEEILSELEMTLEERRMMLAEGPDALKNEPVLAVLIQNKDVIAKISQDKTLIGVYKNIVTKCRGLKVCMIYTDIENSNISFSAPEVMKMMKENRQFLIFDNIETVKLADVSTALLRKFKKALEPGEAYLVRENQLMKIKTVQPDA